MRNAILGRLLIAAVATGLAAAVVVGAAVLGVTAGSPEIAYSRGIQGPSKTPPAPARPQQTPLVETLKDASRLADGVTDPEESLNAHMALAWAQIKSGDHQGAQATLDRAEKAASALGADARCFARVRIAHALGECGGKPRGLALLAQTRIEAEGLELLDRPWPLKAVAVAQSDLGDRDAARATIRTLDQTLLSAEERRRGIWKSTLSTLAEAQFSVGDIDAAFKTCIPSVAGEGGHADEAQRLDHQAWMLQDLAYFAADGNHDRRSGLDPPRVLSAEERASCLAVVRPIVAIVESLPEPNDHRASLVAALGELGAFDEAIQLARRIDQKHIQGPNETDAIWALWRVSLCQVKAGLFDAARATLREAAGVEIPPKAEAADIRSRLANGFLAARDYDEAMKIAETLDPGVRASILSRVARRKKLAGDRKVAEQLFRRAILDAGRFRHIPPKPEP
jgi:tetratricopeptide (TPR) repeat protein